MVMSPATPLPWADEAACAGHEFPEMWFPFRDIYDDSKRRRAIEICGGCPVRNPCAEYAQSVRWIEGIWGGLDSDDRRKIRRKANK
jgi:WhiB family redox-sensing transcriptional regulator